MGQGLLERCAGRWHLPRLGVVERLRVWLRATMPGARPPRLQNHLVDPVHLWWRLDPYLSPPLLTAAAADVIASRDVDRELGFQVWVALARLPDVHSSLCCTRLQLGHGVRRKRLKISIKPDVKNRHRFCEFQTWCSF